MSERTDNLTVEYIKDKKQFIIDVFNEKDTLDNIIGVNILSPDAYEIKDFGVTEVLRFVKDSEYVFLRKIHS